MTLNLPRWAQIIGALIAVACIAGGTLAVERCVTSDKGEVESNPTPDASIDQIVAALEHEGRINDIADVRTTCDRSPGSCGCFDEAAEKGLNVGAHQPVLEIIPIGINKCSNKITWRGRRAEALVRAGQNEIAAQEVEALEVEGHTEPHAVYARAYVAFVAGKLEQALAQAVKADELGRGSPAKLLIGLTHIRKGELDRARAVLQSVDERDPGNVPAMYNVALVAQWQDRYQQARGGYLKVLRYAPKHADARYNLVVLTHKVGAYDEARHHYKKLREVLGAGDERVKKLAPLVESRVAEPAQGGQGTKE